MIVTRTRTKTGTLSEAAVSHSSVRKTVALYSAERRTSRVVAKSPEASVESERMSLNWPPTKRRRSWTDSCASHALLVDNTFPEMRTSLPTSTFRSELEIEIALGCGAPLDEGEG